MIVIKIKKKLSHSQKVDIVIKLTTKYIEPALGFPDIHQEAPKTKEIK